MSKTYLKRLAAPKTWPVKRKGPKFITKALPGPHSLQVSVPLNVLLKEILKYANSTREIRKILDINEIKIDGKARKDYRFPVGIFDTIEIVNINECFRVVFNTKGKIDLIKINKEMSLVKPYKIIGKTMVKGKLQLNLFDGKNIFVDKNGYKVGDTVVISLPEQKINKHLKLDKKSTIFLIGGKHIGEIGNVEDVIKNKIVYKDKKGDLIETSKKYAFVIGDSKYQLHLDKDETNEKHKN